MQLIALILSLQGLVFKPVYTWIANVIVLIPVLASILGLLTPRPLPDIPHLQGQVPILGDLPKLIRHVRKTNGVTSFFDKCAKELGEPPLFQLMMGHKRQVVVNDYQEAENLLLRRSAEIDRSSLTLSVFQTLIPSGQIAQPTGPLFKAHRRYMSTTMNTSSLKKMALHSGRTISKLIDLWTIKSSKLGEKGYFSAIEDCSMISADNICAVTYGESMGAIDRAIIHAARLHEVPKDKDGAFDFSHEHLELYKAMQYFFNIFRFRTPFPIIQLKYAKLFTSWNSSLKLMDDWFWSLLAQAKKKQMIRGENVEALADTALDIACVKQPEQISDVELKDELFMFIFAGQDTTAATLQWGLKMLMRHPQVQHKIHAEIKELNLGSRLPSYEDVETERVPYLESFIWELFRMEGTINGLSREAIKDIEILGIRIPKGTTILIPNAKLGRSPIPISSLPKSLDLNDQQQQRQQGTMSLSEFKPERWMVDGRFEMMKGGGLPFGMGGRGCFGLKLAMLQLKLAFLQICNTFYLEGLSEQLSDWSEYEYLVRKKIQTGVPSRTMATSSSTVRSVQVSKREWERGLASVKVSKDDLNRLILDYLIIEGYSLAASEFAKEALPHLPSGSGRVDYEAVRERMRIREAVESGRVEEGVRRVNELDSEILDTNPPLLFHLHLQTLLELIRSNQIPQALTFASEELAPRGRANPEFLEELERALALLVFPELGGVGKEDEWGASSVGTGDKKDWTTLGDLMRKEQRIKVAKELNSAILESQGQGQETKLGGLIRLMSWGESMLRDKGITVPGVDVTNILSGGRG